MNFFTRLIGYSVLLLLVFLVATLGAESWLRQQTQRLRAEAIEAKRAQFTAIARAITPPNQHWQAADGERLGAMTGGKVSLYGDFVPAPPLDPASLYFDQKLAELPLAPVTARVVFPASLISRLLVTYQRVTVGLMFFGFTLLAIGIFFAALNWRSSSSGSNSLT